MSKTLIANLTDTSEKYLDEVLKNLEPVFPNSFVTTDDAVNYVFDLVIEIETMLTKITGINDPVDFLKGINDGTIMIVKKQSIGERIEHKEGFA